MLQPRKLSLLIVEDDRNIRFLMEVAAQRSGLFEPILSCDDGTTALDALQSMQATELPDMVVSDLSMPKMTGVELVHAMKRDPRLRRIPVAIITSSNVPNDRELAFAAGVCAFVAKPYGVEALMHALMSLRESCIEAAATEKVV